MPFCTMRARTHTHTHIFNPCSLLGPLLAGFAGGGRDTQLPALGSALTCVLDSPSPFIPAIAQPKASFVPVRQAQHAARSQVSKARIHGPPRQSIRRLGLWRGHTRDSFWAWSQEGEGQIGLCPQVPTLPQHVQCFCIRAQRFLSR